MLYKNAIIFDGTKGFYHGSFAVEDGYFTELLSGASQEAGIDLGNAYVIPGLVDIHTHGNSGADFSDGSYPGLVKMARHALRRGVTSFAPASMTLPYDTLEKAFQTAVRFHREAPGDCARLVGIHMEGPFLSSEKKGAQNADYLKLPDIRAFEKLYTASGGLLRIVDIAPELEGAAAFAREASALCTVGVAHTASDHAAAAEVFDAGATHLTHLFNAMPSLHHREPGPIGAASERERVFAELICDGLHVHESAVRLAFKLFPGRICLVSDSGRCAGLPDGTEFEIGGQTAKLVDGVARLPDGTIACSAADLFDCLRNAIRFGISPEEAILAATINPARQLGVADELGSIASGKRADFVVCDRSFRRKAVFLGGVAYSPC